MFRVVLGITVSLVAAGTWILSTPDVPQVGLSFMDGLGQRGVTLKGRVHAALDDGKRAQHDTQNRLEHQYQTFRLHPDRPATS
ncbi:MAG: hypothetical protein NVSMB52_09730 [Chloroflexota bacterium]